MSNQERSAFIRELKKNKAALAATAKEDLAMSGGFLSDEDLIKLMKLSENKQQFQAKLSRVRYGIDKNKDPYFAFNYVITQGSFLGTAVSVFVGMGGKNAEDRKKNAAKLYRILQSLDVDTTKWKSSADEVIEKTVQVADDLTSSKPSLILSLNTWGEDKKAKPPKPPRLGVEVVSLSSPASSAPTSHTDDSETEYEDVEGTEEETEDLMAMAEQADADGEVEHAFLEAAAAEYDLAPDQYDTWVELVEAINEAAHEASGDEEEPAINGDDYVGYECEFNADGTVFTVTCSGYDADTQLFTVTDDDGNEYETSFDNLDFGNGYGVEG